MGRFVDCPDLPAILDLLICDSRFKLHFSEARLLIFWGFGEGMLDLSVSLASTKHIIGYDESDDKIVYDVRAAYIEPFPSEPWSEGADR